jgi:hypothetical protein
MVVEQAFAQPEQPVDARVIAQPPFDLFAVHPGIAVRVEQALLGGDGKAGAVDVDAPPPAPNRGDPPPRPACGEAGPSVSSPSS